MKVCNIKKRKLHWLKYIPSGWGKAVNNFPGNFNVNIEEGYIALFEAETQRQDLVKRLIRKDRLPFSNGVTSVGKRLNTLYSVKHFYLRFLFLVETKRVKGWLPCVYNWIPSSGVLIKKCTFLREPS